jgi:hypothetical protein
MKVGDLVKLKRQGSGLPSVGIIHEIIKIGHIDVDRKYEYRCLWDNPYWNSEFYCAAGLEVISESR